jgi:hypothetical protein
MRAMTRLRACTAFLSLAAALIPSSSRADQVSGTLTRTYVIVEDTDLVGNVTCDIINAPCFSFGASNVELRLNGFAITGRADPVTGCGGAFFANEYGVTSNGQHGVVIRGPLSEYIDRGLRRRRTPPFSIRGEAESDASGRFVRFSLRVDHGVVVDAAFEASACATLVAYCEFAVERGR